MNRVEIDKTAVILRSLEHQFREIQRREEREQKLFEWSSGLLLAAFAAIVALSGRTSALPHALFVKTLASILIGVPTIIFSGRLLRYSKLTVDNAEAIERIEEILGVFEEGVYGEQALYPPRWRGQLARKRSERKTPHLYSVILLLMAACVIATIWLLL